MMCVLQNCNLGAVSESGDEWSKIFKYTMMVPWCVSTLKTVSYMKICPAVLKLRTLLSEIYQTRYVSSIITQWKVPQQSAAGYYILKYSNIAFWIFQEFLFRKLSA